MCYLCCGDERIVLGWSRSVGEGVDGRSWGIV